MVSVLPVIPAAELNRPPLAAPVMLSELPDTRDGAGGCERCAGDCARGVHAVAAHVALRGEPVQRGRAREGQRVRQQAVTETDSPNCGAHLGVFILQPHACAQRFRLESFAGRGQMWTDEC